jgi:hypothetical protein
MINFQLMSARVGSGMRMLNAALLCVIHFYGPEDHSREQVIFAQARMASPLLVVLSVSLPTYTTSTSSAVSTGRTAAAYADAMRCGTRLRPSVGRRDALRHASLAAAAALALQSGAVSPASARPTLDGYDPAAAVTAASAGRQYFPPLTPPVTSRATYRYELGRNAWALEQLLSFTIVSATVRTVVVRLKDGGLWMGSPQYPTGELCHLLDKLGPVKHVVLPCSALEHKAPMKAFLQHYPTASVWVS